MFYIGIDVDGTIVEHEFPSLGAPVPGAIEWMKRFNELGAKLILHTMRSNMSSDKMYLADAVQYCVENEVELFDANHNKTQFSWTKSPKTYCHIYIDDAAYGCPLIYPEDGRRPYADWSIIGPGVEQLILEKYNKKSTKKP
jgi:hypothetical protein